MACGLLADRFPWTLDLTADKTFSLSDDSTAVIENVNTVGQPVTIEVLVKEETFENPNMGSTELDTIFRQFHQFVQEYESRTNGLVKVKYVDLVAQPKLEKDYVSKYDATSGDILFICGNQFRKIAYSDIVGQETDYTTYQTIYTSLAEQKLATNVNSVVGGKTVTVTFLTGHSEDTTTITTLKNLYELNGYFTQTLDFTTAEEISDTTGALVIAGPVKDYSTDEIKRLRDWLHNDGKLGRNLFVYCYYLGTCPNLYDFLEQDCGITVTNNLITATDKNSYVYDPRFPIASVSETDLTAELRDESVLMTDTLQIVPKLTNDTENEAKTNHTILSFGRNVKLAPCSVAPGEEFQLDTDKLIDPPADLNDVVGMAYYEERDTVDHENIYSRVVVCGSSTFSTLTLFEQYANEALSLEPLRKAAPLGNSVSISSQSVSPDVVVFSEMTAVVLDRIFTLAIPLLLIVVALVVFLRRRHL